MPSPPRSRRQPLRHPLRWPLLAVLIGTSVFGAVNAWNAWAMAPNWGQDLAFFHQIIAAAARGDAWSSPLLLEPGGFFEMVHTHLILPVVIAAYLVVPRQEVLLFAQAGFACLALWPAWRLGEAVAGRWGGPLAALGLAVYGPFQAVATADFRPSALLLPGVLGAVVAARERKLWPMVAWACVANLGRQEAPYLLGSAAVALCVLPWGEGARQGWWSRLKLREGLVLGVVSALWLLFWVLVKPQMFFHFDPLHPAAPAALSPDHLADRLGFLARVGRSGMALALLAPGALGGALPVVQEMLATAREWGPLQGPAAHYHAFWLPLVSAAAIAGAGRLGWPGLLAFGVLNAWAFPWVLPRHGPVDLRQLQAHVGPEEAVAADYDTIHAFAGRAVLWNTAQLSMRADERPRGWTAPWPIPLKTVDVIIVRADDPWLVGGGAPGWTARAQVDGHVLLAPLVQPDPADRRPPPAPH